MKKHILSLCCSLINSLRLLDDVLNLIPETISSGPVAYNLQESLISGQLRPKIVFFEVWKLLKCVTVDISIQFGSLGIQPQVFGDQIFFVFTIRRFHCLLIENFLVFNHNYFTDKIKTYLSPVLGVWPRLTVRTL